MAATDRWRRDWTKILQRLGETGREWWQIHNITTNIYNVIKTRQHIIKRTRLDWEQRDGIIRCCSVSLSLRCPASGRHFVSSYIYCMCACVQASPSLLNPSRTCGPGFVMNECKLIIRTVYAVSKGNFHLPKAKWDMLSNCGTYRTVLDPCAAVLPKGAVLLQKHSMRNVLQNIF